MRSQCIVSGLNTTVRKNELKRNGVLSPGLCPGAASYGLSSATSATILNSLQSLLKSQTYTHDNFDRVLTSTTGGVATKLNYDFESRLTSICRPGVATNSFTYNGLDTRVGKVDSQGSTSFLRDGAYVTDPVIRDSNAAYTPGISERRGSATTFLHSGLKNADSQSSTSQTISASRDYDAYGNVISSTGTWSGPFGYAGGFGYQEDGDYGLKLLGHRYYDSSTGRFLTRDPVKDGRNWFGYCGNDPIQSVDPDGQQLFSVGFKVGNKVIRYVVGETSSETIEATKAIRLSGTVYVHKPSPSPHAHNGIPRNNPAYCRDDPVSKIHFASESAVNSLSDAEWRNWKERSVPLGLEDLMDFALGLIIIPGASILAAIPLMKMVIEGAASATLYPMIEDVRNARLQNQRRWADEV